MVSKYKRYVIGRNEEGKSAVLIDEATNVQENPGFFWRAILWSTREVPVDNTIEGDRANEVTAREPFPGGMLMRILELPPDPPKEKHLENFLKLNKQIKQKYEATEEEIARHPTMYRTDTLDCIYCCKGEIHLITDVDNIGMRPGDSVVIRGTNRAWSNQSNEPALLVGCMIDAHPLP
jgi:hypothetical protein